jgi:UDP-2,3-diacylglucosamine pyrophosphatase LpxH
METLLIYGSLENPIPKAHLKVFKNNRFYKRNKIYYITGNHDEMLLKFRI